MIILKKGIVFFAVIGNSQQIISEMIRIISLTLNIQWFRFPFGVSINSNLKSMNIYCFHPKYIILSVEMQFIWNVRLKTFKSVSINISLRQHLFHYFNCRGNIEINFKNSQWVWMVSVNALLEVESDVVYQLCLLSRFAFIFIQLLIVVKSLNLFCQI